MKIPSKINKRQYTLLSKQNKKFLTQEIESQNHDLMIEADFLADDWVITNKYMDDMAVEHTETLSSWNKEVKRAFKEFIRDKKRIEKAHQKFLDTKAKK